MNTSDHTMEQAFLDDIVANPRDPSPWLILSDWLEDQDDPRAEVVRLRYQLQYECDHPEFDVRQERLQALLVAGIRPIVPTLTIPPGIQLAWLPAGTFLMGSPPTEEQRGSDERQHPVTLTHGFWMGVYPVTQEQWLAQMGHNPSAFTRQGNRRDILRPLGKTVGRLPVESVSWSDAQDFCDRLTHRTGLPIRLPTEAEWEYACRAGTTSIYHFGQSLNGTLACCHGLHPYGTSEAGPEPMSPAPVGSYPPNAWGLYDMHGNVWEWCLDWWHSVYLPETTDPVGSPNGTSRVCRGGSWDYVPSLCRSAYRSLNSPGTRKASLGFRVCFRPS
jgi:uncharacterized protein (TIGR02996 family)